jgi:hypothetical protein
MSIGFRDRNVGQQRLKEEDFLHLVGGVALVGTQENGHFRHVPMVSLDVAGAAGFQVVIPSR